MVPHASNSSIKGFIPVREWRTGNDAWPIVMVWLGLASKLQKFFVGLCKQKLRKQGTKGARATS
jgi:hypothetical protein